MTSGYISNKSLPVILFGDHNLNIKFIEEEFFIGADGIKMLKTKDGILPKYLYHYLSSQDFMYSLKVKMNIGFYQRHWSCAKSVKIPIPPLDMQIEIAEKMDAELNCIKSIEQIIINQQDKMNLIIKSLWK